MTQTPSIELSAVAKTFRARGARVEAVRALDLAIAPGETVALLGPNGAGKSTTVDLVLGLTRPDRGAVRVLGLHPRQAVQRGLVGAMLQTGALIRDVTVRELLHMAASLYPAALGVDEVLELVSVSRIADRRTQKLSGGETQRVRFALAAISDPSLLLLDEPTVGMDVEARRAFWSSMRALAARGKTIVFATHYMDEAETYADRVVLLSRGRLVADGPTTEIRALTGRRTIRATLPDVAYGDLLAVPGVDGVERRGAAVVLSCSDSDGAIRALLDRFPALRDIEIAPAALEDAFVQLTHEDGDGARADGALMHA